MIFINPGCMIIFYCDSTVSLDLSFFHNCELAALLLTNLPCQYSGFYDGKIIKVSLQEYGTFQENCRTEVVQNCRMKQTSITVSLI